MGRHTNLPFHLYVNVSNRFLGPNVPDGITRGIWHGVYAREHQVLLCHILLESGAHWSGMPLHALSTTTDFSMPMDQLMPWFCMGEVTETYSAKYLEGLSCSIHKPFTGSGRHTGIMIDWSDGYSRYPQEHKPLNLIELESGQFALLPNNFATYQDKHFTSHAARENMKYYRRGEEVYWE